MVAPQIESLAWTLTVPAQPGTTTFVSLPSTGRGRHKERQYVATVDMRFMNIKTDPNLGPPSLVIGVESASQRHNTGKTTSKMARKTGKSKSNRENLRIRPELRTVASVSPESSNSVLRISAEAIPVGNSDPECSSRVNERADKEAVTVKPYRGRNGNFYWFFTQHAMRFDKPPTFQSDPTPVVGDFFIHQYSPEITDAWVLTSQTTWVAATPFHTKHPILPKKTMAYNNNSKGPVWVEGATIKKSNIYSDKFSRCFLVFRQDLKDPENLRQNPATESDDHNNGKFLASGGSDGKLVVWSTTTGEAMWEATHHSSIYSVIWSAIDDDKMTIIAGVANGEILLCTLEECQLSIEAFDAHTCPVEFIAARGNRLASGGQDEVKRQAGRLDLISELPRPPLTVFSKEQEVLLTSLSWMEGGDEPTKLLASYLNQGIVCWNIAKLKMISQNATPRCARVGVSPDFKYHVVHNISSNSFDIYFANASVHFKTLKMTGTQKMAAPLSVQYIHEGNAILGGSLQGDVKIWDATSGERLQTLSHEGLFSQPNRIQAFCDHMDDCFLIATATSSRDGNIEDVAFVRLWKAVETDKGPSIETHSDSESEDNEECQSSADNADSSKRASLSASVWLLVVAAIAIACSAWLKI
ncbi:WD40 repeat-like protein [Rickenella mellea]|uniref:WD40 repeat-like protein n=1 Tax=Rickenella mellea TaxID=50990 RepID=A0A4Y7PIB7_9AGAM|nr:WD40 repeat-like protein [Rickenella mellea]